MSVTLDTNSHSGSVAPRPSALYAVGNSLFRSTRNRFLPILILFLVAFPKSGVKVGGVPITTGYVLLAFAGLYCAVIGLFDRSIYKISRWSLYSLIALLPLQVVSIVCFATYGAEDTGLMIAYLVSFIFLPTIFLFIFHDALRHMDTVLLVRCVRAAITFVSLYGIFLFIWRINVGEFLEIPFLTVNADDAGDLDNNKNIMRGEILKLISTYNNGNIFGVCILMMLPIYDLCQRHLGLRFMVRVALILTLSRTVWIGLLAYEIFAALYVRRASRKTLLLSAVSLCILVAGVAAAIAYIGLDSSFLFDKELGGRTDAIYATQIQWLPDTPIFFPSEIIYVNMLNAFGVFGVVFFIAALLVPVVSSYVQSPRGRIYRAITLGMINFLICGWSDGPMLLIPVMAIYWALASIAASRVDWSAVLVPGTLSGPRLQALSA